MSILIAQSPISQREQNLFSRERQLAKAHSRRVVQRAAYGCHHRRQQRLADAVEFLRFCMLQRAGINLPWTVLERGNVIIAQVRVDELAIIVVSHFLEQRLPETEDRTAV